MSTLASTLIELLPDLELRGTTERTFRRCFRQLAALKLDGDSLKREVGHIRVKHLSAVDPHDDDAQRGRVVISVLCDLRLQGWVFTFTGPRSFIQYPDTGDNSPKVEKQRVQAGHLIERDNQLIEPSNRRFIRDMERRRLWKGEWTSIFSLMRDGGELAGKLTEAAAMTAEDRVRSLKQCVTPYFQFVETDSICEFTGLRLMDIWRYFRHTWTTSYNSTPGRKMFVLVRDAAAHHHPVIGIAALGSAVVQLSPRDRWIGWTVKEFLDNITLSPSREWARWVTRSLRELMGGLYIKDFLRDKTISRTDLRVPGDLVIQRLRREATESRNAHTLHWKIGKHKASTNDAERADWRVQAETYLFRSKRAKTLADLLEVKARLKEAGFRRATKRDLVKLLEDRGGRLAIQTILRYVKAVHAGVDMLDITICGAIEPYRAILGGKLVSLLMASPETVQAYENRYKTSVSLIASAMAGKPVLRKPRLVLLGTTSLYGVSSSQYNRLRVKIQELGAEGEGELRYELLGKSEGFGSYHFSAATMIEMDLLLRHSQEGRRVNSIFGEGVNPKLRKVRGALDIAGLPADMLLRHGSPRLIYGVALASNYREVLMGLSKRARYILPKALGKKGTARIASYWTRRWLTHRIESVEVLEHVAGNVLTHPIKHGARVVLPESDAEGPLLAGLSVS